MKKILLTGATDGIGYETAKLLAAQGHYLLIHGRSDGKLSATEATLKAEFPNARIESYRADLSSFIDIKEMLKALTQAHTSIDIVINNAGIFKTPEAITADGLDIRFVVNTFAPYIITQTLQGLLADDGRIINLSSAAQAPVYIDAMQGKHSAGEAFQAYAQSKLAITIWSQALAETLKPKQVVMAVNPGSLLASKMVTEGFGVTGNDLSIGADILVRTALSDEFAAASGQYYDNDAKQLAAPHDDAQDPAKCARILAAIQESIAHYYGELI